MKPPKKTSVWLYPLILVLLAASSCSRMPQGNPDNGERWFRMNRCNGCHGEKGIGGKGIGAHGPALAGFSLTYGQFIRKIRNPDSAIMPPYGVKRLSDQDAADIFVWLKQQ